MAGDEYILSRRISSDSFWGEQSENQLTILSEKNETK